MKLKSYRDLPVKGKRVLVRVDYNVPFDKQGNVSDDSRVRASLPTLDYLIKQNAKIILMAHLGRPKGKVDPKYSLKPVVKTLEKLAKVPVSFAEDCIGPKAKEAVNKLKEGQILLLENLRYHPEEEKNDEAFGKELASLAEVFIQDAFGAVHRAHASTSVVTKFLPSAAGALLEKELEYLNKVKSNPARPFTAILGGAKVSDKIGVVEAFVNLVDNLFIGGAMAYTFLKSQGVEVGDSLVENDSVDFCKKVMDKAKGRKIKLILPLDHLMVQDIEKPEGVKTTDNQNINPGWKGVDIGPKTIQALKPILEQSKTIFWNGPAGIFEVEAYSKGTKEIANMVASATKKGAISVVGGGDSVAAVAKAGVTSNISFISTGGGASLEFLEGQDLPGVSAIPKA